jgi:hypothetical protein
LYLGDLLIILITHGPHPEKSLKKPTLKYLELFKVEFSEKIPASKSDKSFLAHVPNTLI